MGLATTSTLTERQPVPLAEGPAPLPGNNTGFGGVSGGGGSTDEDALQARLDALRRG